MRSTRTVGYGSARDRNNLIGLADADPRRGNDNRVTLARTKLDRGHRIVQIAGKRTPGPNRCPNGRRPRRQRPPTGATGLKKVPPVPDRDTEGGSPLTTTGSRYTQCYAQNPTQPATPQAQNLVVQNRRAAT